LKGELQLVKRHRSQQWRKLRAAAAMALIVGTTGAWGLLPALSEAASADTASAPAVPTCSDPNFTEQQLAYATAREKAHDYATARAIFERLIGDCHADTRRQALEFLLRLPSTARRTSSPAQPPSPSPIVVVERWACPDPATWEQRFLYVGYLREAKETAAARAVLESALGDCNPEVRQRAADGLKNLRVPPPPPGEPAKCPDFSIWKERFEYATDLEKRSELDAARTVLAAGLLDCNNEVRAEAVKRLVAQEKRPALTGPEAKCPGERVWTARIDHAKKLIKESDIAAARAALIPALADCDASVRKSALENIYGTYERPWYQRAWDSLNQKFSEAGDTVAKALAAALAAVLLLMAILLIVLPCAAMYNRKRLRIEPLSVYGVGFDGKYFVEIARAIAAEMEEMRDVNPTGVASNRGTLIAAEAGGLDNMVSAAGALAGDSASKLLTALFALFDRPRYRSTGTVRLPLAGQVDVMVQIRKGRRVIGNWQRSSAPADLIEDLKDLAYLVLLTRSRAITPRGS
jgi:hypothetical protein